MTCLGFDLDLNQGAVLNVLQSLVVQFQSERVHWFINNQNVVRIVLNSSKKPLLQKLALEIL